MIVIAQHEVGGHRLYYVRLLIEGALARGQEVTLALGPGGITSPEAELHLPALLRARVTLLERDLKALTAVEALSVALRADLTVVPDGDRIAIGLGARGRWRGVGRLSILIMREVAQPHRRVPGVAPVKTVVRQVLFSRARKVRDVRIAVLKSPFWRGETAFEVARDPVTVTASSDDVQRVVTDWGLDAGRFWFAVLGSITARKNAALVAKAFGELNDPTAGLLFAGRIDGEVLKELSPVLAQLRQRGLRVVVVNELLTDSDLDAAVSVSDCVILAHSNEGPSGLLGKAVGAGSPVLASGAESLRQDALSVPELIKWCPLSESEITSLAADIRLSSKRSSASSEPAATAAGFAEALL